MNKEIKLSTGIPGLDTKIGGGIPSEGIGISVVGFHGAGKRTLCIQILYESLKRGEPGLYVSIDKPYFEVRKMFAQIGANIEKYEKQEKLIIVDCTGAKPISNDGIDNIVFVKPQDGIEAYENACYTTKKERLGEGGVDVIDSVNSLMEFIGSPSEIIKVQKNLRIEIGLKLKTIGLHIVDIGTSHDGELKKLFSFDRPLVWFREDKLYKQIRACSFPDIVDTNWLDFEKSDRGISILNSTQIIREIYICSTCHDFRDLRAEIKEALFAWEYEPILNEMADFPVKVGTDSYTSCIEAVKKSDCLVLIIGSRYGGIVEEENISITQKEYQTAYDNKIPVIIFCLDSVWNLVESRRKNPNFKYPSYFTEGKEKADKVFKFLDLVRKYEKGKRDNWVYTFKNSVELKSILKQRFDQLRNDIWKAKKDC